MSSWAYVRVNKPHVSVFKMWPDDLLILWNYLSSNTAVPWTVWRPSTGLPTRTATQRQRDGSSERGMSSFVTSDDTTRHCTPRWGRRGARLGVPRGQAELRPLATPVLDPFQSDLRRLTSWEKLWRHEALFRVTWHPSRSTWFMPALENVLQCLKRPRDQKRNP